LFVKSDREFGWIFADCGDSFVVFDLDSDADQSTDYYDYVLNLVIDLYGLPADLSESEENEAYSGHCDRRIKLGTLSGSLVLGDQAEADGYDLYEVCDANSGDLEYAMAYLLRTDFFDEVEHTFFYLYDLVMEPGQERHKSMLLRWIPSLLFRLRSVRPAFTVFFPRPLPYEEPVNKGKELLDFMAFEEARKKMDALFALPHETPAEEMPPEEPEVEYRIPEQVLSHMRQAEDSKPYPDEAIDLAEFHLYRDAGFVEIGTSRLLVNVYGL
jgi:hypothetical protein